MKVSKQLLEEFRKFKKQRGACNEMIKEDKK